MLRAFPPGLQADEEVQLGCPIIITTAEEIEDEEDLLNMMRKFVGLSFYDG
jgi:hypothetical protein